MRKIKQKIGGKKKQSTSTWIKGWTGEKKAIQSGYYGDKRERERERKRERERGRERKKRKRSSQANDLARGYSLIRDRKKLWEWAIRR